MKPRTRKIFVSFRGVAVADGRAGTQLDRAKQRWLPRSCIPPKSNRKAKIRWNRRMYRERNRIERMIGHLKINRAIATRYDKLARSFLDALHIAAIRRCLRYATL
jgi:transposase